MHMILLGAPITAHEARAAGIVADTSEPGTVLDNVLHVASKLASMSLVALSLAKEAICRCKASCHEDEPS
jgi:enoyl-CoA hydratase/carnithine racemase